MPVASHHVAGLPHGGQQRLARPELYRVQHNPVRREANAIHRNEDDTQDAVDELGFREVDVDFSKLVEQAERTDTRGI